MKRLNIYLISYCLFLIAYFLLLIALSTPVHAEGAVSNIMAALGINNPFKYKDLGCLMSNVLSWGIIGASLFALLFILWGGIQWVLSGGDKGQLETARNRITASVIGLTVVAAVWAIFMVIRTALGLPIGIGNSCSTSVSGGTGGTGGTAPTAWTCSGPMCDCCNILPNKSCCQQIDRLTSCVVGRYRNSQAECSQITIDWKCWEANYARLVQERKLSPATDACTP